jgi:hypothetical protein
MTRSRYYTLAWTNKNGQREVGDDPIYRITSARKKARELVDQGMTSVIIDIFGRQTGGLWDLSDELEWVSWESVN